MSCSVILHSLGEVNPGLERHEIIFLPIRDFLLSSLSSFPNIADVWKLFALDTPRMSLSVRNVTASPENLRMFIHFFVHEDLQFVVASLFCQCVYGDIYETIQKKLFPLNKYLTELENKCSIHANISIQEGVVVVSTKKKMRIIGFTSSGECETHYEVHFEIDIRIKNGKRKNIPTPLDSVMVTIDYEEQCAF